MDIDPPEQFGANESPFSADASTGEFASPSQLRDRVRTELEQLGSLIERQDFGRGR
jgi:hypothetical protein